MPLSFISISLGELRSTCLETAYLHLFMHSLPTALTIATASCMALRYRLLIVAGPKRGSKTYNEPREVFQYISSPLWTTLVAPVNSRIHFKILILTFKSIYALCPSYISDLITVKSKSTYIVLDQMIVFIWNVLKEICYRHLVRDPSMPLHQNCGTCSLPAEICDIKSLSIFKQRVKTHLFQRAFRSFIITPS